MTPRWMRSALVMFLILSGVFASNVFVHQPGLRTAAGSRSGGAAPPSGAPGDVTTGTVDAGPAWTSPPASEGQAAVPAGNRAELTRAIQRELKTLGYETGAVDGMNGLVTRAAIMAYEADHGLALTGETSEALLQRIVLGGPKEAKPRPAPAGVTVGPEAQPVVAAVQRALASLGYAADVVDGQLTEATVAAIRAFEGAKGLPVTGRISGLLVAKLSGLAPPGAFAASRS